MTEPNYKNRPSAVRTLSQEVNSLSLRTGGYCRFDIVTSHTLHGCFPSYILGFSSIFIFYFNKSQAFFFAARRRLVLPELVWVSSYSPKSCWSGQLETLNSVSTGIRVQVLNLAS